MYFHLQYDCTEKGLTDIIYSTKIWGSQPGKRHHWEQLKWISHDKSNDILNIWFSVHGSKYAYCIRGNYPSRDCEDKYIPNVMYSILKLVIVLRELSEVFIMNKWNRITWKKCRRVTKHITKTNENETIMVKSINMECMKRSSWGLVFFLVKHRWVGTRKA